MILDAAGLALRNLFAPETRSVFWKVIGLTLLVLAGLWFALRETFVAYAMPWVDALMPGVPEWARWLTFIFGIFASRPGAGARAASFFRHGDHCRPVSRRRGRGDRDATIRPIDRARPCRSARPACPR
jgi:hypothetical protein